VLELETSDDAPRGVHHCFDQVRFDEDVPALCRLLYLRCNSLAWDASLKASPAVPPSAAPSPVVRLREQAVSAAAWARRSVHRRRTLLRTGRGPV
jgi:hypothetical protein